MTVLLQAHSLRKSFARTEALRGVSVEIAAGETVAITGPSGSGKSTLMLCLAGILRPEAGEVVYDQQRLDRLGEAERTRLRRREMGIVLQFGQLVPELTAVQNVALPLLLEKHDRASARRAALSWLERLGADDLAEQVPAELSGGQAQRVAVARALVTRPEGRLRGRADGGVGHCGRRSGPGTAARCRPGHRSDAGHGHARQPGRGECGPRDRAAGRRRRGCRGGVVTARSAWSWDWSARSSGGEVGPARLLIAVCTSLVSGLMLVALSVILFARAPR